MRREKGKARKKNNRAGRKIGITLGCGAMLAACVFLVWKAVGQVPVWGKGNTGDGIPEISREIQETENGKGRKGDSGEARQIYENNKALLILVNKDNPLEAGYDPGLRSICDGRLQASDVMYQDLVQMLEDGDAAGYTYWIASAYRSRERQEELMRKEIQKNMGKGMDAEEAEQEANRSLMEPGYSEHETGLALDILCSGNMNMDESQADEGGNKWMRENGWRYGFVLRYPKDKEDMTQIAYEPWHFRYVGPETAEYLWTNQMTLEEFYENMQ